MSDPSIITDEAVAFFTSEQTVYRTSTGRIIHLGHRSDIPKLWMSYTDDPLADPPTWSHTTTGDNEIGDLGVWGFGDGFLDVEDDVLYFGPWVGSDGASADMSLRFIRITDCSTTPNIGAEQTIYESVAGTGVAAEKICVDTRSAGKRIWVVCRFYTLATDKYDVRTVYAPVGSDAPSWTWGPVLSDNPSSDKINQPIGIERMGDGELGFVYVDNDLCAIRTRDDDDDPSTVSAQVSADIVPAADTLVGYSSMVSPGDGTMGVAVCGDFTPDPLRIDFQQFNGTSWDADEQDISDPGWVPSLGWNAFRGRYRLAFVASEDAEPDTPTYIERVAAGDWTDSLNIGGGEANIDPCTLLTGLPHPPLPTFSDLGWTPYAYLGTDGNWWFWPTTYDYPDPAAAVSDSSDYDTAASDSSDFAAVVSDSVDFDTSVSDSSDFNAAVSDSSSEETVVSDA